jgi:hypothetical protein
MAVGLNFGADADFLLEVREKSRWDDRGCIFSRSRMVQVVVFPPVFGGAVAPGAVRFR